MEEQAGQARIRHVGAHAAVEDGSVEALGFTVVDLRARRRLSPRLDVLRAMENVFDTNYPEAQTFFPSRLLSEPEAVDDVHFTPGNPRAIRLGLDSRF